MTINDITIRTHLVPGDLGYIIYRQGKLYSEEYNFGVSFEAYLSAGIYEFYKNYDATLDRVWVCEHNTTIVGFVLLMHLYMDFLKEKNYKSCYLWTTHEQQAAAALYKKHGFILTEEVESTTFGKTLTEQRYELVLS
jgi:hypothetical protein